MTFDEYVVCVRNEFPKFQVKRYLDNRFFALLWRLGWRMAATTLWNTVYMADDEIGTARGMETLRHEVVHVRDQHRWHVLFFLTYFLLPVGPSFKAFWEWRAYKETLRSVYLEYEGASDAVQAQVLSSWAEWVASQFWNSSYGWMWPFPSMAQSWCSRWLAELRSTHTQA